MFKYIIGLALLVSFDCIRSADAIRCYQCNSLTQPDCAKEENLANVPTVDCDSVPRPNTMEQYMPVTKCNKIITSDRAGKILSRGCLFEIYGQKIGLDSCLVSHNRILESCDICEKDLCNGASQYTVLGLAVILIAATMHFAL